jgi:hypothetical protein
MIMRALILATVLTMSVAPAMAASWQSGMVEDEGGPQMMAWVDGQGGDVPPDLYLMCAGDMGLNLRYSMGSGPGEGIDMPPGPLDFMFTFGGSAAATLSMQYEEYDGAYAGYFPKTEAVLALMRGAANMTIGDPTGVWHEQVFPLVGSSAAIDAVLATCE